MSPRHWPGLSIALVALGCGSQTSGDIPRMIPTPVSVAPEVTVPTPIENPDPDSIVASLSLRQKIGQLVIPWISGAYRSFNSEAFEDAIEWVEEFEVGGIIVSVGSPTDVAIKLNELQRRSNIPLLVSADLEFGAGMRLLGATAFPRPMAFGATGRELDAYQLGRVSAIEARAVGIHMTYSPVADLNNNPENPIINTRSWGEDPETVSNLIEAYVRGARDHGLFTTAKHFPGHGDTGTDSHIAVPTTDACWDRLDSVELVPFRRAIRARVTAVMTAHISLPCIDSTPGLPATLSEAVMTRILRDSLGFDGLVVTDALIMGAVVNEYGTDEAVLRAFEAGSDVLLMPTDIGSAIDAMEGAVLEGRIPEGRIDASLRRILSLKAEAGLFGSRFVNPATIPHIVGTKEHLDLATDIAGRSLTVTQLGPLDSLRQDTVPDIALITYAEETNLAFGGTLTGELRSGGATVEPFRLYPASGPLSYDSATTVIRNHDYAVFASSVRPIAWRGHVALPDSLASLILETQEVAPTQLVSFGSPYLLSQLPGYEGGYLLAWGAATATEKAVAAALLGSTPIGGRTPIELSEGIPRGSGLDIPAVGGR